MLSILYGIASALSWGAADFAGGLAARRLSTYRVCLLWQHVGFAGFVCHCSVLS